MTENMKIWLKDLLVNEAKEHHATAEDCHIMALGSEGESAEDFEQFAVEHLEFANILEDMAENII